MRCFTGRNEGSYMIPHFCPRTYINKLCGVALVSLYCTYVGLLDQVANYPLQLGAANVNYILSKWEI